MRIFAEDIHSAVSREECGKLCDLAEGKVVLELGSDTGRSTVALASVAKIVHAVDWHRGDYHAGAKDTGQTFIANIARYNVREKVAMHMCRFEDFLTLLLPAMFDMIFIDALHTKEAVTNDIKASLPLLKPNGVMAFHDYGIPEFGVTQAVDEFAKKLGVGVEVTRTLAVVRLP